MALSVGRSPNNHNAVEIRRPKEELTIRDGRSLQIRTRRDAPSASGSAAGCSTSSRRQQPAVSSWSTRSRQQGYTEAYAFWPRRTPLFRLFCVASLPSKKVQTPSGRARGARPRGACAGHARVAHGMRTGSGLQLPKHPCASPAEHSSVDGCSGLSLAALHVHVGAFVWNETCACRQGIRSE